jgi:asparagine synthase (glutamine-hydrolysing)
MDLAEMVESELSLEVAADVPVGAFFSGGIDSSVVAAFSPKSIGALFVDYSDCEDHPDLVLAKDIARLLNLDFKRTHHVVGTKSVDEILDEFRAVAAGTEDPISDYTFYATKIISRVARAAGYKVMLSGMGGDELFAGYPRHALVRHLGIGKMLGTVTRAVAPLVRATERWGRRIDRLQSFISADGFLEGYTNLVGYFSYDEVSRLLGSRSGVESYENTVGELLAACEHRSPLKKALWLDRFGYLSHNLTVTDKASMSEGLEVRVPLITERLARMGMSLRDAQLIRGIEGKLPLKRLLEQKLPKKLIYRRKRAFNPPLRSPIQRIGPKLLGSLLLKGPLRDVLDTKFVEQWINQHFQGQADHTYRLWQLLYFSMWLEIHDSKG